MAVLGAGVGAEVWIHGRQLEAAEERITKATQEQVKATVGSEVTKGMEQVKTTVGLEVTKSMEQFEKKLLASVTKVVQEEVTASVPKAVQDEVTPMKVTLQDIQGRVEYLDSASMAMTNMLLANCQKKT